MGKMQRGARSKNPPDGAPWGRSKAGNKRPGDPTTYRHMPNVIRRNNRRR